MQSSDEDEYYKDWPPLEPDVKISDDRYMKKGDYVVVPVGTDEMKRVYIDAWTLDYVVVLYNSKMYDAELADELDVDMCLSMETMLGYYRSNMEVEEAP